MASIGVRCGGACSARRHTAVFPRQSAAARSSLSIADLRAKSQPLKAAISISRTDTGDSRAVSCEKIDEWMRESVVEIVKNLRQAPLFVHVYPESSGPEVELRTERAVASEDWEADREKWEKGEAPLPEGVIFVEELQDEDDVGLEEGAGGGVDRAWGIVVQRRGSECGGPACYLLKTSRVGSGFGFCTTHFCLMRVKSFREKAKSQFKNCWLVQSQ